MNLKKFIMRKVFALEHSAWRQMKENYQIYLPYQFRPRVQSALRDWRVQKLQKIEWTCSADVWARVNICIQGETLIWHF